MILRLLFITIVLDVIMGQFKSSCICKNSPFEPFDLILVCHCKETLVMFRKVACGNSAALSNEVIGYYTTLSPPLQRHADFVL